MAALPAVRAPRLVVAVAALLALAVALGAAAPERTANAYLLLAAAAMLASGVYVAWNAEPAWTLTAGLILTIFGGQWERIGIPSVLAPDRILLLVGLAGVILRGPGSRLRESLEIRAVHWLMLAGVLYAAASAVAVGTLFDPDSAFVLLERYGVIPFLLFLCAPVAFRGASERNVLLAGLVVAGAYLGVTAVFEGIGADGLVFPQYITDESVGIHSARARGPFLEAGTNGLALFACGAAAVLGATLWKRPLPRRVAIAVALLCAAGLVFTLTRQVWIGAALGALVGMLVAPGARRYLAPVLMVVPALVVVLFVTVPGLAERADERRVQQGPIYDRYNQIAAAVNAVEERPLFGVGWQNFVGNNEQYVVLLADYPLSGTDGPVHNVPLTYASELGLIGATLWIATLLLGVAGAVRARVAPGDVGWKALLVAVFTCFIVVSSFQFATAFANILLWTIAGVVLSTAVRRGVSG